MVDNQGEKFFTTVMLMFMMVKVEDLEKKKDPVKLVDMENEINNGRLFDNAFVSTNEEVQVRKHF